jgi:integrase
VKRARRQRPNGAGSAVPRGKTWTAVYNASYAIEDGKHTQDKIRLGGFATKREALDFIPVLKASAKIPKDERNKALRSSKELPTLSDALVFIENYKRKSPTSEITFKALYERWYPFYEQRCDKSTMNGHRAALAYFRELWGAPFASLSADDLQDCIDACPKGRRTQENMKSLGKRLYEYAIGRAIVDRDYATYVYISKEGNKPRPALKPEHVELIRRQIGKYPFAEYVYCLCYLGHRPNEMLQLTKDAYRKDGEIEYLVGGFKTAAGTDRAVTLSPQIAQIVRRLVDAPGAYIFPGPDGEMIDDEYFREKIFYPLLAHLKIQSLPDKENPAIYVPYSCRHFFANLLKDAKGADKDKAALMGHSDYETTVRIYQSEDLKAMQKITNSFA